MKWSINPYSYSLFADAESVNVVLQDMLRDIDVSADDVEYSFLHDVKKMLSISREIESDILRSGQPGQLYVGFQNGEKLAFEADRYSNLVSSGVDIIAFGTGYPASEFSGTWVSLSEDHLLLENQWFLVTNIPEPVAFVGWEMSESSLWGKRGLNYAGKSFAGFMSKNSALVGQISRHLRSLAS